MVQTAYINFHTSTRCIEDFKWRIGECLFFVFYDGKHHLNRLGEIYEVDHHFLPTPCTHDLGCNSQVPCSKGTVWIKKNDIFK